MTCFHFPHLLIPSKREKRDLEMRERSSRSLLANVIEMEDDRRYCADRSQLHASHSVLGSMYAIINIKHASHFNNYRYVLCGLSNELHLATHECYMYYT